MASADTRLDPEYGRAAPSSMSGRQSCRSARKRRRETGRFALMLVPGRFGVHEMACWQVNRKLPQ